jgi:hypothetical protein
MEIKVTNNRLRDEIRDIIRKNKVVKEEHVESLADEMYIWFLDHKRNLKKQEFNKMLKKYL